MDNIKKYVSPKYDVMFKRVFADERNIDILAAFLGSVLGISEELEEITIVDPHLKKETAEDKLAILDLKVKIKNGTTINCEIQLIKIPELKERIVYYTSKLVTEQLQSGKRYGSIKPVVSIVITDFKFINDDAHYSHTFETFDAKKGVKFDDTVKIVTLELPKLPTTPDSGDLWYWLKFFRAEGKEDLDMLVKNSEDRKELKKAVALVKELSQDEKIRAQAEYEEMQRRDYISRIEGAEKEGLEKGMAEKALDIAKNLLSKGMPETDILEITGISQADLNRIK